MKYKRFCIQIVCMDYTLKQSYTLLILFLVFASFCQKTPALTFDEFLKKIPEYIEEPLLENPENREEVAERVQFFTPFLLRGFELHQQRDKGLADLWLEQLCQWIAENYKLNDEKIYNHIVEWFREDDPDFLFQKAPVHFVMAAPSDDLETGGVELLRRLSAFSIAPETGEHRIVLYGSRGLQAQLYRLYGEEEGVSPNDWDFMISDAHFPSLLYALQIPSNIILTLCMQHDAMKRKEKPIEPLEEHAFFENSAIYLSLRENHDKDGSLFTVKYLTKEKEEEIYSLELSIDFFFVGLLPEASLMPFRSLGYLPVLEEQSIVKALRDAIQKQPGLAPKHTARLSLWLRFEDVHNKLSDRPELLEMIRAAPLQAGISHSKFRAQVISSEPFVQIGDPNEQSKSRDDFRPQKRLLNNFNRKERYRNSRALLEKECPAKNHLSKENQGIQRLDFYTDAVKMVSYFQTVIVLVDHIWQFVEELEASFFLQNIDVLGDRKDQELKTDFHTFLFLKQMELSGYLNDLYQMFKLNYGTLFTPWLMDFALQLKVCILELGIGSFVQSNHLARVPKNFIKKEVEPALQQQPDLLFLLRELYQSFYDDYTRLKIDHMSGSEHDFKIRLSRWSNHLKYINLLNSPEVFAEAGRLPPIVFLYHVVLQLQVFYEVLDDIPYLCEIIPQALSQAKQYMNSIPSGGEYDVLKMKMNHSFDLILSSLSCREVFSTESKVSPKQVLKLLESIEKFPIYDGRRLEVINEFKAHQKKVEDEQESQLKAADKIACENAEKLQEQEAQEKLRGQEIAVKKARKKLFERKKTVINKSSEEPEDNDQATSLSLEDVPAYKKDWKIARKYVENNDFLEAEKLYKRVLKQVSSDSPENAFVLIELADMSLQKVKINRKAIVKLHQFNQSSCRSFQSQRSLNMNGGKGRTNPVSKEALLEKSRELVEYWSVTEPKLEEAKEALLDAHNALTKLPIQDNENVDGNRELLESGMELLHQHYQFMKTVFGTLREVFTLRGEWLRTLGPKKGQRSMPEQTNGDRKVVNVGALFVDIKRAQESIEEQISQLWAKKQRSTASAQFPVNGYLSFQVPGDGNCFYSALAIALNQLNNTAHWTAPFVRQKIHQILENLIKFINRQRNNKQLKAQLELLLGVSFDELTGLVSGGFLLSAPGATCNPDEILMHYGEVSYAFLLLLDQPLAVGVQGSNSEGVYSYSYNFWLQHAPLLLSVLIQQGEVNIDHWPEAPQLINHLQSGSHIPDTLLQQIEQQPLDAILVHSGSTGSLAQHFNVVVRHSPSTDRDLMKRVDGLTGVIAFAVVYVYHKSIGINSMRSH